MKVKRLHQTDTKLPAKAHDTDLGYDLFSNVSIMLEPQTTTLVGTGIAIEFPSYEMPVQTYRYPVDAPEQRELTTLMQTTRFGGLIRDRSGFSTKNDVIVIAGVIDHDYRGEIKIAFHNLSNEPVRIERGDKIAQMILIPVYTFPVEEVTEFDNETARGTGGFGSTGA